jgi:Tfp pilus assembly protein PilF
MLVKLLSRFFSGLLCFGMASMSIYAQTNQALLPSAPTGTTNAPTAAQPELKAKTPFEEAAALTQQEKYEEALPKVNAILQADPKNFDALNLRGYIYTKQKSLDLAQKDFDAML